jgi:hypothetical protein
LRSLIESAPDPALRGRLADALDICERRAVETAL